MRKLFALILLTTCTLSGISQSTDTLFVSKLSDMSWTKNYSNSTQFSFIKFEDGSVVGVGEKMKFGTPIGTNQSTSQTTGVFSSSTTRINNFSTIILGRLASVVLMGITYLPETFKGREAKIENIKIARSRRNDIPSSAIIIFQNQGMDITVMDTKSAIENGELINLKASMTSDQALSELKRAKDKLDLGLITQEKFDSLRNVLAKIIK